MALDAGTYGRAADPLAAPVDVDGLVGQIYDDAHKSVRRSVGVPDVLTRFQAGRVRWLGRAFVNRRSGEPKIRKQEKSGEKRDGCFSCSYKRTFFNRAEDRVRMDQTFGKVETSFPLISLGVHAYILTTCGPCPGELACSSLNSLLAPSTFV